MTTFTYGATSIDTEKLPAKSLEALIRRGIAHFLGNEQASKVASHFKDQEGVTDEAKEAYKNECVAKAVAALHDGTIGNILRGPKGTSIEAVMRGLAEKEVRAILKTAGLTMPSGDKVVEFASGEKLTKGDLIGRRLAKHGDRLKKEAETEMKRAEREAVKAGGVEALL